MALRLKFFRSVLMVCLCTGGFAALAPVQAQTPAPAPAAPATDPAQEATKRAFEALPEADRVAIQDGLIWTGDYKGIADGKFGKGTRDSIAAFATRNKLPADGTLDTKGRALLAGTAKQAKDAVNFSVKADERTGVRIGLPLKLLTKVKPLASGTRYSTPDESFSVETKAAASGTQPDVLTTQPATTWKNPPVTPAPATLQESFNAVTTDAPGRKVTYKVLRPDFFVVTGEAGANTFYTRMTRGERGIAGFTITYPAASKARFDPISIAIANSFVPFSETPTAAPAVVPSTPSPNSPGAPNPPAPNANAVAANTESPTGKPVLIASGVTVAPGLILTSLPHSCSEPQIGAKKAKIAKQDEAAGLTLLSLPDAPAATLPLRATDPAGPAQVVVLSFAPHGNADELIGGTGDLHKSEATGAWRLLSPLQSPVAGAAVLDRGGALAGLVPSEALPGKSIAGVLPQMNRVALPASKLSGFLAEVRPKPAERVDPHTTGEIAALGRAAMVPIYCMH